jgi:hypothetical protein
MQETPTYVETNADGEQVSRLPNALREYLLTFDEGVSVLRVWESLLLANFLPGQVFTRQEASDALAEGVGRPALEAALQFSLDGEPLFRFNHRLYPTNAVRIGGGAGENQKRPVGAPTRVYEMPSVRELCQRLHLNPQQGDPLRAEDLQTRGTYRSGMHRELIQHRTDKEGDQKWQGKRLGVTERTIQRYNESRHHKR